jgi:type II secretory pathway pseudopilin PulG
MSTRAPKRYRSGKRRQRGAALLVLLTMLILGVAAVAVTTFRSNAGAREAQALHVLGEAREALIGYAVVHGRLPRPSTLPSAGLEDSAPCASEQQCTGYLPWATLGLPPMYARGKPLRYSVTPAFAAPTTVMRYAMPTKTIASRQGERLVYMQGSSLCSLVLPCSPAVLIASGKYQGAGGSDQQLNDVATAHFIQRPASDRELEAGGAFDDLLTWLPYDSLIRRASTTGALDVSR